MFLCSVARMRMVASTGGPGRYFSIVPLLRAIVQQPHGGPGTDSALAMQAMSRSPLRLGSCPSLARRLRSGLVRRTRPASFSRRTRFYSFRYAIVRSGDPGPDPCGGNWPGKAGRSWPGRCRISLACARVKPFREEQPCDRPQESFDRETAQAGVRKPVMVLTSATSDERVRRHRTRGRSAFPRTSSII